MNPPQYLLYTALAAGFAFLLPVAQSADVSWGSATQISGASDVSTTGNLIGAFNVGDTGVPSTTVNGVTFQSFATNGGNGSSGNFTAVGSGPISQTNTGHGSANAPFSALPVGYQTLLQSASIPFIGSIQLTISGLVLGMQYQFQWWSNDSDGGGLTTATAGHIRTLSGNTSFDDGGLGEWAIGTFTADAATQAIAVQGDGDFGSFNAFQLRQLVPSSRVPDSGSTLMILSSALGALAVTGRKFRRA